MIRKVITGGQSGVDQGGWRAARAAGLETGGLMPPGFWTEDGFRPDLASGFGAEEMENWQSTPRAEQLRERTRSNVRSAGLVLWYGPGRSPGYHATRKAAREHGVPMKGCGSGPGIMARLIRGAGPPAALMIAGPRESRCPGIGRAAEDYFRELFAHLGLGMAPSALAREAAAVARCNPLPGQASLF